MLICFNNKKIINHFLVHVHHVYVFICSCSCREHVDRDTDVYYFLNMEEVVLAHC